MLSLVDTSADFEAYLMNLFQKGVVSTKFDIYVVLLSRVDTSADFERTDEFIPARRREH